MWLGSRAMTGQRIPLAHRGRMGIRGSRRLAQRPITGARRSARVTPTVIVRQQWDNRQTSPVGSFKPNAFGLYDMAGNVWQWVGDC